MTDNVNSDIEMNEENPNSINENADDEKKKEQNNIDDSTKGELTAGGDEEKEDKMSLDKEKKEEKESEENKTEQDDGRSILSLEGAKKPLSIYTRRVMDISKIDKYLKPNSTRGQCGGRNLGNTCFMNSSIACLSNTTELTYYFLKGDYKKDINENNTLGMQGELAKSWGELMHQYWVENTGVGDPSDFKYTIGRKAKRFRGYAQQDSNEFMSVFLDYINEDLNRTTKKQYIELKEKGENETDEECAKRFWECNLRRNDSIITDLFCGQFKSTITCPDCGFINITFDPFDTINLPLLTQKKRRSYFNENIEEFQFFYIPKYGFRHPFCVGVKDVEKNETLRNLINRIKKENDFIYHDKLDELLIVDIYKKEKYGFAELEKTLSAYNYTDEYLFSFKYNENDGKIKMQANFYENSSTSSKSLYPRMLILDKNSTLDDLRKELYFYARKYILSPFLKEDEKKDKISEEIEKYLEDKNLELNEDKLKELIEKEYREIFKLDEEEEKKEKEEKEEKEKEEKEKKDDEKKENEEEKNKEDEEMKDETKKEEKAVEKEKTEGATKESIEMKDDNKKYREKFIEDLPFEVFIQKERSGNNYMGFINKQNFFKLSEKFKNKYDFTSYKDILDKTHKDLNNQELLVVFNQNSKYINKDTFNLDYFDKYSLDYKEKKKVEKKEEEDELSGTMTLEKCLKKFVKEEQLEEGDEWYCSKCKKHVLATKKMELFYLPKILIICFKRFIKDSSYSWDKNDDEVDFPINNMDMKDFVIGPDKDHSKYDLFAVSQHYGSTGGGHYTAICKNDGKWFSYNDSSCHETSENNIVTSAAYVLFYRRQTD